MFDENLKSINQTLASVKRFEVGNLKNTLLRKLIFKISKLEKLLKKSKRKVSQCMKVMNLNITTGDVLCGNGYVWVHVLIILNVLPPKSHFYYLTQFFAFRLMEGLCISYHEIKVIFFF